MTSTSSVYTNLESSHNGNGNGVQTRSYSRSPSALRVPHLIQVQIDSFEWFKTQGLADLFDEVSPIEDLPGGRFELTFQGHYFDEPKHSEEYCRDNEITFSAPLYVTVQLYVKAEGPAQGEKKEQTLFVGDIPMMTSSGTFIINGAERVVVSQLVRSPGVYFTTLTDPNSGRLLTSAKLIPYRGAWMEFDTSVRNLISVKVDRKRKTPVTMLLKAMGFMDDKEIFSLFEDVDTDPDRTFIQSTIDRDTPVSSQDEALVEFYRRLRPGEPPSVDNAKNLLNNLFFNPRRYDLGRVGRYKLNRKLHDSSFSEDRTLFPEDIIGLLRSMIEINNGRQEADDIDHLGNRRVRAVGELIQNQVRVGLLRMERVIKERMTTEMDPSTTTPAALINIRPIVASVREFFGGSQLSQFMDQTNPLAELTHKRRLSALGPGGLSRERAGFDVRDVHHSHYGRICPIETPEGPNIGLLGSLATYARTNEFGFIETPYRVVKKTISNKDETLLGRQTSEDIVGTDGKTILRSGNVISKRVIKRIQALKTFQLTVKPYVSLDDSDIRYLSADEEESVRIAQANSPIDHNGQFIDDRVEIRLGEGVGMEPPEDVGFMDVSPVQLVSVSTSLIPFLEHDDANRALMGSNMQRQAVPLVKPQPPLVSTGMEGRVAKDSGQLLVSPIDGLVVESTADRITIVDSEGTENGFKLRKFLRSNQGTCINQRPIVNRGDYVRAGDILCDSSSTGGGELALGQNVLVAFMSWEGYNFEDAIILSERLVKDDRFTSIHIEKHECEARDTKLGAEEITHDIPNVGEDSLRDLDEDGVIRIGAEIGPGDILVGKITPKGETELSAEEKLLRAIFGEKARDVKDTSLRVPHGQRGKVIDVRVLSRANGDDLPPGVNKLVRLWIAQTRKISEGDKMAGRHGNKGVVARILPESDMPFLPDGTPVDIILNPIGVPSRMNLGQVMETHLGWAANALGFKAVTPVFEGALDTSVEDALAQAWLTSRSGSVKYNSLDGQLSKKVDSDHLSKWLDEKGYDFNEVIGPDIGQNAVSGAAKKACLEIWMGEDIGIDVTDMSSEEIDAEVMKLSREKQISAPTMGKSILYDGLTGEPFDQPVTTGYIYMMKLIHLIEDKIHARSTGPYSLITQQPLGGKAQFGGQRFGEMEVWALEAYSAAFNLQEMLTVKSDDVVGRVKTYESIVKGEDVIQPGIPESFHVLLKELQSLGLSVELLREDSGDVEIDESEFSIDDFNLALESMTESLSEGETGEPQDGEGNTEASATLKETEESDATEEEVEQDENMTQETIGDSGEETEQNVSEDTDDAEDNTEK